MPYTLNKLTVLGSTIQHRGVFTTNGANVQYLLTYTKAKIVQSIMD